MLFWNVSIWCRINDCVHNDIGATLESIVNFEHISHLALVFLLLTLNMQLQLATNGVKLAQIYYTEAYLDHIKYLWRSLFYKNS